MNQRRPFASRAGLKLDHALTKFQIDVRGRSCTDLGCNVGGFTDCLLQRGAAPVYAIDTGYGALEWRLRKDPRVVVMERTNALHASLPQPVQVIVIDVAWTRQRFILPAARRLLAADGQVVTLIKPHYEARPSQLRGGVLEAVHLQPVIDDVKVDIMRAGFEVHGLIPSPIMGSKGNAEFLAHLRPAPSAG